LSVINSGTGRMGKTSDSPPVVMTASSSSWGSSRAPRGLIWGMPRLSKAEAWRVVREEEEEEEEVAGHLLLLLLRLLERGAEGRRKAVLTPYVF